MRILLHVCFIAFYLPLTLNSQTKIDSLKNELSRTEDSRKRFEVLNKLIQEIPLQETPTTCRGYQKEMEVIAEQLNDDELRLEALSTFASIIYGTMNMDSTTIVAQKLYELGVEKNSSKHIARGGSLMAPAHIVKGEFEEALAWFDKIEPHAIKSGDAFKMHWDRSQIYLMKGNFNEALKHLEKTLTWIENNPDKVSIHSNQVHQAIAYAYDNLGDRKRGAEAFRKSYEKAKSENHTELMAQSIINLASNLNSVDSTFTIQNELEETYALISGSKKNYKKVQILLYLSDIETTKGLFAAGSQKRKEAKELIEKYDLGNLLEGFYQEYSAKAFNLQKKYREAAIAGEKALAIGKSMGDMNITQNARRHLIQSYHALKNISKENRMLREYYIKRDSLNEEKNLKALALLEEQVKDVEREKEIALLAVENKQTRTAALGSSAFALLALGFFFNARRKNQLISTQNEQLESLNHTKDRIFAIIGHDLRKPAASFRGISKKVKYLIKKQDFETLDKLGNQIEQNALSLNKLTDNLLNWALTQRNVMPYNPTDVPLGNLTADIQTIFESPAQEKNIEIVNNVPADMTVFADPNALSTIITNLVDNAVKYTPEGGEIRIDALVESNNQIKIRVSDTGTGIEQDKINDLFLLKKDKSKKGTDGEKGTGLGLHLVKELVQLNQGKIGVDSIEGEGTSFRILLPLKQSKIA